MALFRRISYVRVGIAGDRPTAHGADVHAAMVNAISPGPIDIPLLGKALGSNRDGYVQGLRASLPLHRLGTAEEAGAPSCS